MSATTVVTGGCGFVGRHLVDALVDRGDAVRVLDLDPKPWRDDVDFRAVDIRDADAVSEACAGATALFHNASLVHTKHNQVDTVWSVNQGGTRNLLEAARRHEIPRFVYVSSASAVYEGRDIENGDESMPYSRISQAPYADSKIAAEKEVLAEDGKGGVRTIALRPHVIFGPGDVRFLPAVLKRAKAGKLKFGVGRGRKLSDFTYVTNLTDALLLADDKLQSSPDDVAGEAFFITNGEPRPFFDFVGDLLERLELPPIKGMVPFAVAYPVAAVAEAIDTLRGGTLNAEDGMSRFAIRYMCTHHYFSIEKARRLLGYDPQVDLKEGIERTAAHLEATGAV